jgi:hypothetical protein
MASPFVDILLNSSRTRLNGVLSRGDLITFNYAFHKPGHDTNPLVLVTDPDYPIKDPVIKPGYMTRQLRNQYIRGINLHYLTFPVIKKLIFPNNQQSVCENPNFTYQSIKGNEYISSAFRQYKKRGIGALKKLDCRFIVTAMGLSRSFDPNEIEAIRNSVREQINRIVNPPATASDEIPI